ncbi:hypothetical protein RCL_jg3042.t1 [Rhizophagus clarus]|uniref:Uncharacterized protein n=1 Tax=Rhizophagus clarus TaxID=94130 RepID=A0A8H3M6P2_9GLOM|nr:hypothetical protein RCL_jg3042.t1 [Rhizophagus clarus]
MRFACRTAPIRQELFRCHTAHFVLQDMYGKCSKTDLIINSGLDLASKSRYLGVINSKKRLKIFSDRKLSNHLDYATISISRCSHLIKNDRA